MVGIINVLQFDTNTLSVKYCKFVSEEVEVSTLRSDPEGKYFTSTAWIKIAHNFCMHCSYSNDLLISWLPRISCLEAEVSLTCQY